MKLLKGKAHGESQVAGGIDHRPHRNGEIMSTTQKLSIKVEDWSRPRTIRPPSLHSQRTGGEAGTVTAKENYPIADSALGAITQLRKTRNLLTLKSAFMVPALMLVSM